MSSFIRLKCACGKTLRVPTHLQGKRIVCPACKGTNPVVADTSTPTEDPPRIQAPAATSARQPLSRKTARLFLFGIPGLLLIAAAAVFIFSRGTGEKPPDLAKRGKPEPKPLVKTGKPEPKPIEKKESVAPVVKPSPQPRPLEVLFDRLDPPDPQEGKALSVYLKEAGPGLQDHLVFQYRVKPEEEWRPATAGRFSLPILKAGPLTLEARVKDSSQNVSPVAKLVLDVAKPKEVTEQVIPVVPNNLDVIIEPDRLNNVTSVALSEDGKYVVTGHAFEKKVILWDSATGRKLRTFLGPTARVLGVAISGDGQQVAAVFNDHKIAYLWDAATGKQLHAFEGHTGKLTSIGMSADGQRLVTGAHDNTANLWDTTTGRKIRSFEGGSHAVCISRNGKFVVTGSGALSKGFVAVWEVNGRRIRTFNGFPYTVTHNSLAISDDGRWLLTSWAGQSVLWDVATAKKVWTSRGSVHVALSRNGQLAVSVTGPTVVSALPDPNSALVWQPGNNKELHILRGHTFVIRGVALSGDGRFLVTGSEEPNAVLWDVATGSKLQVFQGRTNPITTVALSADGRCLAAGYRVNTTLWWDMAEGKAPQFLKMDRGDVISLTLSADGKQVVTGSNDGDAVLWDAATGKRLQRFDKPHGYVYSVALVPDGKQVLTSNDGETYVWDVAAATKSKPQLYGERWFALSRDGSFLAGAGRKSAHLWNLPEGRKLQDFHGHTEDIKCVAISGDARFVATGADDRTAILWNAVDGKKLHTLKGHGGYVNSVALSGDGKWLVSGSWDQTAILWETTGGAKLHTLKGHTAQVTSVAIGADGKHILTGSEDDTVRLWDAATGKERCRVYCLGGGKDWVVCTPDGLFDASPGAWRDVTFRVPGSEKLLTDDETRRRRHRPGLLTHLWKGT